MLKEIVEFSKELEKNGIYELIQKDNEKIDKIIMVIPVNEDMTDILVDESYFVVKDIIQKENKKKEVKNYILLDDKNKTIEREVKNFDKIKPLLKTISNEDEGWRQILRSIASYTKKFPNDVKGNKCIGSNKGSVSYNLLIFSRIYKDFFKDLNKFQNKLLKTYTKDLVDSIIKKLSNQSIQSKLAELADLLIGKFINNTYVEKIHKIIKFFIETSKLSISTELIIILKLPNKYYLNYNIYSDIYLKYLKRKSFNTDIDSLTKNKINNYENCPNCGKKPEGNICSVPYVMNNLSSDKPFIKHLGFYNKNLDSIELCLDCAFNIAIFQMYFLNQMRTTIFPLFIKNNLREKSISLFKTKDGKLEKQTFQSIIKNIYKENSVDELDFYLIIYNRNSKFLSFDYVTGFNFYKNGKSIFIIENMLNTMFSKYNKTYHKYYSEMKKNYFTDKVKTENNELDSLIYRFRINIFDYVYRAKYNSLNRNDIKEIYFEMLKIRLKDFYNNEIQENIIVNNIKEMEEKFYKLNNYFGGVFMETVEGVRSKFKVETIDELSYYLGQVIYFLLDKKKGSKSHALIEPFVNVDNFLVLAKNLDDVFNAYKHEFKFHWIDSNNKFSEIWKALSKYKNEKFTMNRKMMFYAGYFDNKGNIFFNNTSKQVEGENNGK